MDVRGRYVVVIGTKRSGKASAELLVGQGARVRVLDAQAVSPEDRAEFDRMGVTVLPQIVGNFSDEGREPDLVVLSPAVPFDLPMLITLRARGIPVIGEVELASYFLRGRTIGITGSNGKTTATALVGHLLTGCGIDCQVGGNIGTPVTSLVASSSEGRWNVLELSSFQLETITQFRCEIAACLNVTPDHLDRHHTFETYAGAKGRLFETQKPGDAAVLNFDDASCRNYGKQTAGPVSWFSSSQPVPGGLWLNGEALLFNGKPVLQRSQIRLRGLHNVENVMAAWLMAHLAVAPADAIGAAVETFPV